MGRWVARLGERIIGQGGTPEQALWAARAARSKENPQIDYIPTVQPLVFSARLEPIRSLMPVDMPAYLVGGAVRDALLMRTTHDLDFVLPSGALKAGRAVANALRGAYYPLDAVRQTARVILYAPDGTREFLDFAVIRGEDLESDLRARDFTINAMAIDLRHPTQLLDPLGGAADLLARQLRACSPRAFLDDPVRILRGVRLAAELNLKIQPETLKIMRQSVGELERVSSERKRDELFRILDGPQPAKALRALEMLGALVYVLPELVSLKNVMLAPPVDTNVWTHTLDVVRNLATLLDVLDMKYKPDTAANLSMGLVSMRLGRYREQLAEHLKSSITPERPLRSLLFLAALFHEVAQSQIPQVDESAGDMIDNDIAGAQMVEERGEALHLSNDEIARLKIIVRFHRRTILLAQEEDPPSRRAIYRFFRDVGDVGVEISLLSLADTLATYGPAPHQDMWARHINTVRMLYEAWWEHYQEYISPPALLGGHDLIDELRLKPGLHIGQILEAIKEAQATGQVTDRDGALSLARSWLAEHSID
ncbi:MAG TPA: HD domain-containing protein [Anaerolineales bacterium]